MSGLKSRRKGHDFERATVRRMRDVMPNAEIRRGLQYRMGSGETVPDVEMPCFWVECKCGKQPNIRAAMRQACDDSMGSAKWPLAVVHDDRSETYAVMMWEDFLDLVEEWWEANRR